MAIAAGLSDDRGTMANAEAECRRAVAIKPGDARAWCMLGTALCQAGGGEEGLSLLQRSIALRPDVPEFRGNLAAALGRLGRHAEAEGQFREALRLRPDDATAWHGLGVALEHQDRFDEAVEALRRAVALQPCDPKVHTHLSNVLRKGGQAELAEHTARHAIDIDPTVPDAHNALGAALMEMNRVQEGAECFRRAVALRPDFPDARLNLATAMLAAGELPEGFRAFECRVRHRLWERDLPGIRWALGSDFDPAGKTVLVYSEGGLGNMIQFVRFASILASRGARVILESPRPLLPLLNGFAGVAEIVSYGSALPAYDAYAGIMSLPALLGVTAELAGTRFPYLSVDGERSAHWGAVVDQMTRQPLPCPHPSPLPAGEGAEARRRVGVCWRGDQRVASLRGRSFPPAQLLPLAQMPGVTLINLQHGVEPPGELPIVTLPGLGPREVKLEDVAAVMRHLDLVITCDTSIAHLAGALGVPVWVALKHAACWRWMLDREDSPWYPTMRLFRQPAPTDWNGAFNRMTECLKTRLSSPVGSASAARAAVSHARL